MSDLSVSQTNLASGQVDDLEGMLHNAHGHQLLAIVAAMHHHRARQTLHNRAGGLAEAFNLVATSAVRQVLGRLVLDRNVVLKNWVTF